MNNDLAQVIDKLLDSNDTTVGGGAASALIGAFAASTIAMVARLSKKKPVNFTEEQYDAIISECDSISQKLQEGCVGDRAAYCGIVDAFRLPKGTDEEKKARSLAVQKAATKAAEVPRDNGLLDLRVLEIGLAMKGNSNPACMSDLQSAIFLATSGAKDCALNIEANLGLIKDETVKAALKEDMLKLFVGSI